MIRWFFKWLFRLVFVIFALAVIAVAVLLLSYNAILRNVVEHNIREQTGMDAEIGRFHLSLTEPTVEIQNLKVYNPPGFGGAPFLDIPEIHIEYDRAALKKREIHITLMRLNLAELDIVKNQNGQTNIFAFANLPPQKSVASSELNPKKAPANAGRPKNGAPVSAPSRSGNQIVRANPKPRAPIFQKFLDEQTDFDFTKKIDVLNVSVGKLKFIDLKNPGNDRTQTIGLQNIVIPNVKSEKDIEGLAMLVYLRSGGFFESLGGQNSKNGNAGSLQDILRLIGEF